MKLDWKRLTLIKNRSNIELAIIDSKSSLEYDWHRNYHPNLLESEFKSLTIWSGPPNCLKLTSVEKISLPFLDSHLKEVNKSWYTKLLVTVWKIGQGLKYIEYSPKTRPNNYYIEHRGGWAVFSVCCWCQRSAVSIQAPASNPILKLIFQFPIFHFFYRFRVQGSNQHGSGRRWMESYTLTI